MNKLSFYINIYIYDPPPPPDIRDCFSSVTLSSIIIFENMSDSIFGGSKSYCIVKIIWNINFIILVTLMLPSNRIDFYIS